MNILLISGHGNGDPGAVSRINGVQYREADETRAMTDLIKKYLGKYCSVVQYPKERNAYHDYHKGVLSTIGNFKAFDYVLEVHFNAYLAGQADGKTKGTECYVTTSEKSVGVETKICENISKFGFRNRGVKRYNYAVINTAKKNGTSSALLEVCFIDDPDDMAIYVPRRDAIAKSIADAVLTGFGIEHDFTSNDEEEEEMIIYTKRADVPAWGKNTVDKLINKGLMVGEGDGKINVEHNMLRTLVILDRAGVFDR